MTISPSRAWLLLLGLVAASLLLFAGEPPDARAQTSGGCSVSAAYGGTRGCTFLEQYGQCLYNALASYNDCRSYAGRRGSTLSRIAHRAGCEVGVQVDLFVCHIGMPIYAYKQIQPGG